jgi:hypothetical protein
LCATCGLSTACGSQKRKSKAGRMRKTAAFCRFRKPEKLRSCGQARFWPVRRIRFIHKPSANLQPFRIAVIAAKKKPPPALQTAVSDQNVFQSG